MVWTKIFQNFINFFFKFSLMSCILLRHSSETFLKNGFLEVYPISRRDLTQKLRQILRALPQFLLDGLAVLKASNKFYQFRIEGPKFGFGRFIFCTGICHRAADTELSH